MLQIEVSLKIRKQEVRDEEYLGGGEDQVDGEVVVGVGRVVVDPQLPGERGEQGRRHHHAADDECLIEEY